MVLVFKTKPVVEPRTHRRTNECVRAGVQLQQRRAVPGVRAVHRLNETEVIRHRRDVRKNIGRPLAALAVLLEAVRRGDEVAGCA